MKVGMELIYILPFVIFLHEKIVNGDASMSLRGPDSPDSPTVLSCGGVDLVFLVDTSRSIWELDFQRQLNFIDKVVSKFDIGPGPKQTRVGVILYAHTYWVWFYLRQYTELKSLRAAIKRIPHKAGARTRTEKGLKFLRTHMFKPWYGGRRNTTHVAILISDGQSQDMKKTREEAQKVRDAGIKIFTIGVGKRANMNELREIATDPDEHFVFQVGNFKALDSINYKLPTSTCKAKHITTQRTTSTSTRKPTTTTMTPDDSTIPPILLLEPATYLTLQETNRLKNKDKLQSTKFPKTTTEKVGELSLPSELIDSTPVTATSSAVIENASGKIERISRQQVVSDFTSSVPKTVTKARHIESSSVIDTDATAKPNSNETKPSNNELDPTELTDDETDGETNDKKFKPLFKISDTDTSSLFESNEKHSTPIPTYDKTGHKKNTSGSKQATENPNEQSGTSTGTDTSRNVDTDSNSTQQFLTKPPSYNSDPNGHNIANKYNGKLYDNDASIPINNTKETTLKSSSDEQTNTLSNIISGSFTQSSDMGMSFISEDIDEKMSSAHSLAQTTHGVIHDLGLSSDGRELPQVKIPVQTTTMPTEVFPALGRQNPIQQEFTLPPVTVRGQTTTVSTEILQELAAYSLKPITEDQAEIMSNYILRDVPAQTYCDGKDADIYFVLDGSNSIWPEDFKVQLQFVSNVIDILDVTHGNTRVGVVVYSTQIHPIVMIDSGMTRSQIKRQVMAINYVSGRTNTSDALRFIRQYGFSKQRTREDAVKLAIVLTDGISRSPLVTKKESNLCREQGIHLFAIGIGKRVDKTELKRIANDPDQKFMFHVDSYQALHRIRDFLAITACSVAPDQPRTEPVCKDLGALDVLFSYDSFALGSRKSQMLNFFIHDILNSLDFSNGNLQVGRMTDNCPEITDIPIGPLTNVSDFASTAYPGIPSLLSRMKTGFSNREDVKKLGVLFVDESTDKIKNAITVLKDGIDYNLMVVGIGDPRITEAAGDLCSYPKHDYFIQVPKYSNLLRARSKLLDKICTTMMAIR